MAQTIKDVLAGTFKGRLSFKTHHGLWCRDDDEWDIPNLSKKEVEYGRSEVKWDVYPSRHGGYWIRRKDDGTNYWWMANMRVPNREVLMNPGRDDWESFKIERHPDNDYRGYVIRSVSNNYAYVTAHPPDHSVCLTADQNVARQWENFEINVYDESIPTDEPGLTPTPPAAGPGMYVQFLHDVNDNGGFVEVLNPATGQGSRKPVPSYTNRSGCATMAYNCAGEVGLRAQMTALDTVAIYGRGVVVRSSVNMRQVNF